MDLDKNDFNYCTPKIELKMVKTKERGPRSHPLETVQSSTCLSLIDSLKISNHMARNVAV